MRKSIKSFIAMFIIIFGIFQFPITVLATSSIPPSTSDFYVNDFAGVFSSDEKSRLIDNAVTLCNEHDGIQVVITTVQSLDGDTVENYALEMYNQYGIGKDDMGLLILLSTGDRQIRVEVGKAMEAYINDSKAGRFIDKYAIPSLKENKFNEGLINLQEAFINEIVTTIENENVTDVNPSNSKGSLDFLSILGTLLIICIVAVIISFIIFSIRKIIAKSKEKQQIIDTLTKKLETSNQNANSLRDTANREHDRLQSKINDLLDNQNKLVSRYQNLESQYNTLKDRYERVQILYPTADNDVSTMINEEIRQKDMALAKEVDEVIQKVIELTASKDILSKLVEARSFYSGLNQEQRSYVKSDINRLDQLYEESLSLKNEYDKKMEEERRKKLAAVAVASITAIISCISIGRARDLKKLKEAKSIYDNLDSGSRSYFDKSVANKLEELLSEAKRDKQREEEEERRRKKQEEERRRRMQSSSHSSFSGSSYHSGFGGRSGGGGASRGF